MLCSHNYDYIRNVVAELFQRAFNANWLANYTGNIVTT